MAVNKNFVVKNGLEVNTNLIFADASTDKVGIANTQPTYTLHVNGGIGATHSYVSGIGTFENGLVVSGTTGFNVGAAGSVGIGTNTENYPLEILGTSGATVAQITGNVNVDGTIVVDDLTANQSVTSISTVTSSLTVKNVTGEGIADIDSIYASGITSVFGLIVTGVSTFSNVDDNDLGITTSGSVRISGGVGISKNLTVGSAASVSGSLYIGGKSTFNNFVGFNTDVYINGSNPSIVSYASSFPVVAQETEPRDIVLSNDGKTMYVLGNTGDDITWYNLSTPWRISSASFVSQYSVSSRLTNPTGMYFKPDGTKFYIVGTVGAGATSVNQYTCSVPWDLTTASYDNVSFSVVSQDTSPQGIEFRSDGTRFYILGNTGDAIYEYNCSNPWNVSSASYNSVVYSISAQETLPEGFRFSADGTKLLVLGSSGDDINYYTLPTPWNINTLSFVGIITSLSSVIGETAPSGLYWKPDGSRLYVTGYTNDSVYEFNVHSPGDFEVTGKTRLYGNVETHESLLAYGELNAYETAIFYNRVGIGSTTPTDSLGIIGNAKVSGVVTATRFIGDLNGNVTSVGISTFTDVRIGTAVSISSGIVTATTFVGNLTGNVTGNINSSGLSTISRLDAGTGVRISGGIVTATTFVGDLTGNINSSGLSTISRLDAGTGVRISGGIVTATTFVGNVTGSINSSGLSTISRLDAGTGVRISGGIVTATTFVGDLIGSISGSASSNWIVAGLSTFVGFSTFGSNVYIAGITSVGSNIKLYPNTGIVSATQYYGDGSKLTGVFAGAGGAAGQIQYNNNGSLGGFVDGASQFYWDPINSRVGIGSSLPTDTLNVVGTSRFDGLLDANAGATIDNIRIGILNDNTIDTSTGNLTLDSNGGTTTIADNTSVTGTLTVTSTLTSNGLLDANGGAEIDNVRIGVTNDNTIDTSTGNLTLNSAGGTTTIDDNTSVTGTLTVTSTLTSNGLLDANAGATIDNVRIGISDDNTIDTSTGNLTINSAGGTTTIDDVLVVSGSVVVPSGSASIPAIYPNGDTNNGIFFPSADTTAVSTNGAERLRVDSSGRLLIGLTNARSNFSNTTTTSAALQIEGLDLNRRAAIISDEASTTGATLLLAHQRSGTVGGNTILQDGDDLASFLFQGSDGSEFVNGATISCIVQGTPAANSLPTSMGFFTNPGSAGVIERMRIDSTGFVGVNTTDTFTGHKFGAHAQTSTPAYIHRSINDGNLISFYQASVLEGSITVSGTTVSLAGGHLSRWSQIINIDPHDKTLRPEILRGTVMSNLDEMCEWINPETGEEQENEQINKTKISDIEGDPNVAGVFQSWDDDDDTWVNDYYLAMTGDFVIRIGSGVKVKRGDLLMSAGDGTAKPQDDDIIRSKTIAKVISTNVSCTYSDGSYCVPCVLMAC